MLHPLCSGIGGDILMLHPLCSGIGGVAILTITHVKPL